MSASGVPFANFPLGELFEAMLQLYFRLANSALTPSGVLVIVVMGLFVGLFPRLCGTRTVRTRACINNLMLAGVCLGALYFLVEIGKHIPLSDRNKFIRLDCINSTKGGKVDGTHRDCSLTRGALCTKEEPCTACNVEEGMDDIAIAYTKREMSCRSCDETDSSLCNFVPEVGPYCIFHGELSPKIGYGVEQLKPLFKVRPCTVCCTRKRIIDKCANVTKQRNITFLNTTSNILSFTLVNATYLPYYDIWWDNATNPCAENVGKSPISTNSSTSSTASANANNATTGTNASNATVNANATNGILSSNTTTVNVTANNSNTTNATVANTTTTSNNTVNSNATNATIANATTTANSTANNNTNGTA